MSSGPPIGEALAALTRYAAEAPPERLPQLYLLVSRLAAMLLLRLATEVGSGAPDDGEPEGEAPGEAGLVN
jgi:hypothetical protein